jgi:hypothetical protein
VDDAQRNPVSTQDAARRHCWPDAARANPDANTNPFLQPLRLLWYRRCRQCSLLLQKQGSEPAARVTLL